MLNFFSHTTYLIHLSSFTIHLQLHKPEPTHTKPLDMELSTMLCLFASFLFILLFKSLIKSFLYPPKGRDLPLPPGTTGWPFIGETFQMYSQDPNVFFATKIKRYGSMFKSHILGYPCVMISNPEAAKFVLNKAQLFKPTFPASKERMLGKQAIFFHQGAYHANLRRLVLRTFMPEAIKDILSDIESIAQSCLKSWEGKLITTFLEMKTFTFNVALLSIFGKDEILCGEDLKRCYYTLERGYNSMPINLPGTLFHKAMKARKELAEIFAQIISTRRNMKQDHNDLLGSFMSEKAGLTDEQIADNIIGVIFAARDTTATVLTWIVKYLGENPSVLEAVTLRPFMTNKSNWYLKNLLVGTLQEEQESILRGKGESGEEMGLNWSDTKNMPVTSRVIQETLRIASILSFTFREAVEDVEFQGYLIPKGWKILPLFRNIHHSPDNFKEPEKFDPSRFEVAPKPNTFMPFGNGTHACPGNELAKLEILVLLHHLTTKYRWSVTGAKNGIQYGPFALPQNGLPITLFPKK
ncbi:Abscisic acid 8'-hydroxylase 1 [Mucuna pruriens]|uniref:(+)-abscisic acid 8'-hydroxylase n=1 Tax=Mucuna pruriens TaxID=157652 RepID=A0A371E256_MUCPR|nr:Abscisic acid 8'-hydroxylase 1 [Mucuna pruriens]